MDQFTSEEDAELLATKRKWAVYRTTRENYQRQLEKKRRGEKVNFRERGEHMFSSSLRAPTAEEIKNFCGEGYYITEHLFDGTAGDWSFAAVVPSQDVLTVEQPPQAQGATSSTPQPPQVAPVAQPGNLAAQGINQAAETVEALKSLVHVVNPAQQAPASLTKEEIAQMIEQSNAKLIAQIQSAQPKPEATPDPLQSLVNTLSVLKQLGVIREPEERTAQTDILDTLLTTHEKVMNAAERMNPEGKTGARGWLSDAVELAKELGVKDVVKPIGQAITMQVMQQMSGRTGQPAAQIQDVPTPEMPAQPQPQPEQEEEETPLSLETVITNLANDIINNARPREGIDEVVQLVVAQPELLPVVGGLMDTPTGELIAQLSTATGTNLSVLANAEKYVEGLKKGVRERVQLPSLVALGNNGNGAHEVAS